MEMDVASPSKLRIICLCQSATDVVCSLGLESWLVGRSHEGTGSAFVLSLPCILSSSYSADHDKNFLNRQGGYSINWELLRDLKPDLIFAQSQTSSDTQFLSQAQQLSNGKCRVVFLQSYSVEGIFKNLETIASCCGVKEEGAKLSNLLLARLKDTKQKTPQWEDGMPRVNVAVLSNVNPLIGAGFWVPEIISHAGGLSLCGEAGCPSKPLALGDLTHTNPDVIIYLCKRLFSGNISAELSWLVANKDWRALKAVKANRFFLVDANRLFVDSAPNVISSAELLTEILHGFAHGHEGRGFVRWQNGTFASPKHIGIEKGEVVNKKSLAKSLTTLDHSAYVAHSYEVKKCNVLDKCDDEDAKVIRQVTTDDNTALNVRKPAPKSVDGDTFNAINLHRQWPKPITETLSCKEGREQSAYRSLHSTDSFFLDGHMQDVEPSQVFDSGSSTKSCSRLKLAILNKSRSSVLYTQGDSREKEASNQVLISRVWASARSAAQLRDRSRPLLNKERVLNKSNSLPARHGLHAHSTGVDALESQHGLLVEDPSDVQHAKSSSKVSRNAMKWNLSGTPGYVRQCNSQVGMTKSSFYSEPPSPAQVTSSQKPRLIRDAVLKALVELRSVDCLLLSGGLASSILAEAVPLVHSEGFKMGFTVLAGPAATDRAAAAVASKCKGMEHVIIGEGEKGYAVFLLAKELAFIVETLKTFDPVQIRNMVPIAAALREAKVRGASQVVTGHGLDELLFREKPVSNYVKAIHVRITKILSRSAVLLGEALGVKVVQPFLQPQLAREIKALTCAMDGDNARGALRQAFPEVSSQKVFNEVDSGMFYVSDYFSSAISASVLESKAKHIYRKERIFIRDAEHLVYYRAFKRVLKGKVPKGMVRGTSKSCTGCGYQLSVELSWYCLVCGLSQQSHSNPFMQSKLQHEAIVIEKNLSDLQGRIKNGDERAAENGGARNSTNLKEAMVSREVVKNDGTKGGRSGSRRSDASIVGMPPVHKPTCVRAPTSSARGLRRQSDNSNRENSWNHWAVLGAAGSAGLLLLLQLARR